MNKDTYEFQCKECKENFPYQQDLKDHQCILHLPDLQTGNIFILSNIKRILLKLNWTRVS